MFDKVLLLSASAGAGHVRAAQALEKAFLELKAAREVKSIDVLDCTNRLVRRAYSRGYVVWVQKHPHVWGMVYDHLDIPGKWEHRRLALERLFFRHFLAMLQDERPDLIVCTHFLPPELVSWLKGKGLLDCPQAIVTTDLDIHGMWLCRHFEHYFVSLEESREYLVKLGVPREKVTVSGIPVDPVFSAPSDRAALCRKHGLKPDVTTILISAGGFGMGPVEKMIRTLLSLEHPAQIIPICGRSEELKQRIDRLAADVPAGSPVTVKVVGYTREMHELMSASDILVGKPGGLTMSEALVKGLVFVIVGPIPGQEERNTDHLLEQGAAIRCNNLPVLAWKIDRLLDDPERFDRMRENVRRLAKPRAAFTIVETLTSLYGR